MAAYDYKCDKCGDVQERQAPVGEAPKWVKCDCGERALRVWQATTAHCRYSYMDRVNGNPRFNRGRGY